MNVEIYLKEIGDVHDTSQVTPTNTLGIAMTRSSALIKLAVQRSLRRASPRFIPSPSSPRRGDVRAQAMLGPPTRLSLRWRRP